MVQDIAEKTNPQDMLAARLTVRARIEVEDTKIQPEIEHGLGLSVRFLHGEEEQSQISVGVPPGLEDMQPLKVPLPTRSDGASQQCTQAQTEAPEQSPINVPDLASSGGWVTAVASVVPYLNTEGARRALAILDRAILNSQQAKALNAVHAGGLASSNPHDAYMAYMTELMQLNLQQQQQDLLAQLEQLRYDSSTSLGTNKANYTQAANAIAAAAGASKAPRLHPGGLGQLMGMQDFGGPAWPPLPPCTGLFPDAGAMFGAGCVTEQNMNCVEWPAAYQLAAAREQEGWSPQAAAMAAAGGCVYSSRRGHAGLAGDAQAMKPNADRKKVGDAQQSPTRKAQTLSTSLQLLSSEDPDCLFIVRRINKLGFKASRSLKKYFGDFGTVMRVLVAHSTVRQSREFVAQARRRPSSLGFVQMSTAEGVQRILALGSEQQVEGSLIIVQKFERKHAEEAEREDDVINEDENEESSDADKDNDMSGVAYESADQEGANSSDGSVRWNRSLTDDSAATVATYADLPPGVQVWAQKA